MILRRVDPDRFEAMKREHLRIAVNHLPTEVCDLCDLFAALERAWSHQAIGTGYLR